MNDNPAAAMRLIEVRLAPENFEDWRALFHLLQQSFAYMNGRINPPSSLNAMGQDILAEKAKQEYLVIAHQCDHLVGCGFLAVHPSAIYLSKLAVSRNFRGQGILKAIMRLADKIAHLHGKHLLELQTRVELEENHATFKAIGFSIVGTTSHSGFDRPTSITMQRRVPTMEIYTDSRIFIAPRSHNGGPPLEDNHGHMPPWGKCGIGNYFAWKKAYQAARKTSPDIIKRRVQLARACGLTYEEYT